MKLFRTQEGKEIKHLRISNLGHYYWCSVQAWLIAQGIESPPNEATNEGTKRHNEVTASRKPSKLEQEFEDFLKTEMVEFDCGRGSTGIRGEGTNRVLTRKWKDKDGVTVLGQIVTHGLDDFCVYPDRKVKFIEYKFTNQKYVDNFKTSIAIFQMKASMWLYEPILKKGNYTIEGGEIDFFTMNGGEIGKRDIYYNQREVEDAIANILYQFNHPSELIPCTRWKCVRCHEVFKSRCPFQ